MKQIKKALLILMCLCLVASLFAGCKKGDGETVKVELSTADVNLVTADGDAAYRLVRAESTEAFSTIIPDFIKAFKSKFGTQIKNVSDSEEKGDLAEIIIGNTNRDATAKAKQVLKNETVGRKDDFIICTIENDIVILGSTDNATISGIKYFIENYITGKSIVGGIKYINKTAGEFTDISIAGTTILSDFKLVTPIYNTSYITELQITELLDCISNKTGYMIERLDDNVASKTGKNTDASGTLTPTANNEYEIIIGNATRDGVKAIKDYNAYEIRVEGKKVYLNGGSPYATAMAVSEFKKLIESDKTITADVNVLNGNYKEAVKSYDSATYYQPTWVDDFDGEEINTDLWNVRWDEVAGYKSAANGKDQYRGSSELKNNYVEDGLMYQVAVETEDAYYGGMFDTRLKTSFLYGYLELSTIHPKGMGFWTSLWTISTPKEYEEFRGKALYYSETDVDECYGPGTWAYGNTFAWPTTLCKQLLGNDASTIHKNNKIASEDDRGFYMDFHTFGFEWLDNTHVRFTCDGQAYVDQQLREGAEQEAYSQPQVLRLSLACGSGNHGEPTTDPVEWRDYNKFIVDWVHIYQKKDQKMYAYVEYENMLGGAFQEVAK